MHFLLYTVVWHTSSDSDALHDYYGFRNLYISQFL